MNDPITDEGRKGTLSMVQSNVQPFPTYLTPREAAAHVRLSKSYLDKHRVTGDGPRFIKRGGRIFYRIDWLDEWMAKASYLSTSEISVAMAA